MNVAQLQAAIAFAERERQEAHAAFRRALYALGEADRRLFYAQLDLQEAVAETELAPTTDTTGKARS